jgi:hypothetical protein
MLGDVEGFAEGKDEGKDVGEVGISVGPASWQPTSS